MKVGHLNIQSWECSLTWRTKCAKLEGKISWFTLSSCIHAIDKNNGALSSYWHHDGWCCRLLCIYIQRKLRYPLLHAMYNLRGVLLRWWGFHNEALFIQQLSFNHIALQLFLICSKDASIRWCQWESFEEYNSNVSIAVTRYKLKHVQHCC